ncbi:MAG: CapA family protein [Bacteroidota bacterium]
MKLLIKYSLVAIVFGFGFFIFSKITTDHNIVKNLPETDSTLTLVFMGDVMQHQTQIDGAWNDSLQTYAYDSCFKYVEPIIRQSDVAIANFEFTLGGKPYTGYPQFSAPEQIVNALLWSGINIVGTANNHSCDRGRMGIERTIRLLDSAQLKHTGTFVNKQERDANYPMIIRKKGFKLALLNYTYGTNGISIPQPTLVNLIDTLQMKLDLKRATDSVCDKTIVFIHWGDEYQSQPNQFQKDIAQLCLVHGADIIIGMHPHVIQRIERKNFPDSSGRQVMVAYSLGNFVSNQRDRYKDGGLMVQLQLTKKHNATTITNCGYYLSWVYTPVENGRKRFYILPVGKFENEKPTIDAESYQKMMVYATDSRHLMQTESIGIGELHYDLKTDVWK